MGFKCHTPFQISSLCFLHIAPDVRSQLAVPAVICVASVPLTLPEIERKERSDLHCNKVDSAFRVILHPVELPICERKRPKDCSVPTEQQQMIIPVANVASGGLGSVRVWQCLPTSAKMQEGGREWQNLLQFHRCAMARCGAGSCLEALRGNGIELRKQCTPCVRNPILGDSRAVGYLPKKAVYRKWKQPREQMYVIGNKSGRGEPTPSL